MTPLRRSELRSALVLRKPDDHKGVFGHALIVGGSRGMAGAAILAARSALRSGAGLVTLAVPASLQGGVAGRVPEALTLGLAENAAGCLRPEGVSRLRHSHKEKGYTAMALGPGISRSPDTAKFVILALSALPLPAVVDADALNVLADQEPAGVRDLLRGRKAPCVFTPHPGEMGRCLRVKTPEALKDREASALRLARDWGGVAVLKGHKTLISSGSRTVVNATGGPGLAKGGTGDVLTGLIAGLWAQMLASGRVSGDLGFWAAALGCHLHGLAGDLAEKELSPWGMTARDVSDRLPEAFKRL